MGLASGTGSATHAKNGMHYSQHQARGQGPEKAPLAYSILSGSRVIWGRVQTRRVCCEVICSCASLNKYLRSTLRAFPEAPRAETHRSHNDGVLNLEPERVQAPARRVECSSSVSNESLASALMKLAVALC